MEEIKQLLEAIVELLEQHNENTKEILTVNEASRYLNVSVSYLYKLTQIHAIPFYCPAGKKNYFKRSELTEYLTRIRQSTNEEITAQANLLMSHKRR